MAVFVERLALLRSGRVLQAPRGNVSPTIQFDPQIRISVPRGRGVWRVDPALGRTLEQLGADAGAAVSRAANTLFVPMAQRIQDAWPVATGLSRARLAVLVEQTPTGVKLLLVNTAPYADKIGGDDAVARELVFAPAEQLADLMAEDIAEDLT